MLEFSMILLAGGASLLFYMVYEARRSVVKIEEVKLPHYPRQMNPVSLFLFLIYINGKFQMKSSKTCKGKRILSSSAGTCWKKECLFPGSNEILTNS